MTRHHRAPGQLLLRQPGRNPFVPVTVIGMPEHTTSELTAYFSAFVMTSAYWIPVDFFHGSVRIVIHDQLREPVQQHAHWSIR